MNLGNIENKLSQQNIREIKSHIYVYRVPSMDIIGIYIGELSKEDTFDSINKELWGELYPNYEKNKNIIMDIEKVELWTWEEYKEQQDYDASDRILEII